MAEITMPRLSDTMSEGTIGRWLKQPGEQVAKGDVLAEIETDKATMELESYESGILQDVLVEAGQTVPIGQVIAVIGASASTQEATPSGNGTASPKPAAPPVAPKQPAPAAHPVTHFVSESDHVKASPLARRVATDYGLDLRLIQGTGPGGRILRENVDAYYQHHGAEAVSTEQAVPQPAQPAAVPQSPAPAAVSMGVPDQTSPLQPLSRMRRAIAHKMTEAKNGTPHFYVSTVVDMGEALALRHQINEIHAAPVKISINDMIIKAIAKSLRAYPVLNSSYVVDDQGLAGIVLYDYVSISVAIALEDGLIVPVVRDADMKSLGTIAAEVKDMAARARDGSIKQAELEGGTFTVSNLGMFDVTEFIAIITPPQAGVLAVGSVREQPVVRDHEVVIAHTMHATISADHRVADGATAARCLQTFKELLQTPLKLLV